MIRNNTRSAIVLLAWAAALLLSVGCAPTTTVALPPINITEYELARGSAANSYPDCTILLHNLRRTLDPHLAQDARLSSLGLVEQLGKDNQEVPICLAFVLDDPESPVELRKRVADYLLAHHKETLAGMSPGSPVEVRASR